MAHGIEPAPIGDHLAPFQKAAVEFCVRQGRAALFLDTGLGKTRCQLEWCRQSAGATNGWALILTPLAVAWQIEAEGQSLGYDCRVIRGQSDAGPGINICNYDRLDKIDCDAYGAVALDESSILKSFTGVTTRALIERFAGTRFRLCATATPSPNDHMELGQHAEFLGVMESNEMLARWFIADQTQMGRYRLKGHGVEAFWSWVASWARMASVPSDIGEFSDEGYVLPPLRRVFHRAGGQMAAADGELFVSAVSATGMHNVKRQTAAARAAVVAGLIAAEPDEPWVVWCDTDYEADALRAVIPHAAEVRGSHSVDKKEAALRNFAAGGGVLITKPSVCGFGLNWQHCARMAFVGRTFSYESYYQAIRRCWRFGQRREVVAHVVVADGEDLIADALGRKEERHKTMKAAMSGAQTEGDVASVKIAYNPTHKGDIPSWLLTA